jgi:subtilisin family serine protease
VAGIAAGNGAQAGRCHFANTYIGVAPNADIIVVKVPTEGPHGDIIATPDDVVDAAKYILGKAAGRPVVVNISLEAHPTAAYGRGDLDVRLDALLTGTTRRAIVAIAGNHATGDHFVVDIPPNGTIERHFLTVPGMPPPTAQIRCSPGADVEVTLISKTPHTFGPMLVTTSHVEVHPPGQDKVKLTNFTDHHRLTIEPDVQGKIVTPGGWTIRIHERAGHAVSVNLWGENGSIKAFYGPTEFEILPVDAAGRQAFAEDQRSTMVAPGTAHNVITVGAHDMEHGALAAFSGRGPARVPGVRSTPDVTAPGVDIAAPRSGDPGVFFCCDWWCNFYSTVEEGTSFAAPHVTGVVALMLERNPNQTFEQIRARLRASARDPTVPIPDPGWGWGKVDAFKAVMDTPLPGGGGGGPGGGGPDQFTDDPVVLPFAAETATFWPTPGRLAALVNKFSETPVGQLLAALVSTHVDEVQRLIDTDRRIATLWHRIDAPAVMRALVAQFAGDPQKPHPALLAVRRDYPRRLLERLSRSGSDALRADIAAHGSLVLDVIGAGSAMRATLLVEPT